MNWQVVKDLVAYGREQEKIHDKNFRFTLTTNGVLLNDEVHGVLQTKRWANVVLSIDGRKEVHDHMRPFRNGKGSYDLIVPKFQKFAESRNQDKYYVRGTFTTLQSGFCRRCSASGRSGLQADFCGAGSGSRMQRITRLREEDLPQIFEEYDSLAAEMVRRQKERKGFQFLPFYDRSDGRPVCGKAPVRLRIRN